MKSTPASPASPENQLEHQDGTPLGVTKLLANWAAGVDNAALSASSIVWAKHAMLDWIALVVAARDEPLVRMLVDEYASTNAGPGTIIATNRRANTHDAALINGAAGHALDYDDVNILMGGHPTVPVAPVVTALGQATNASGIDVLRAFIVGYETQCWLGQMCMPSHYVHGFHATGTLGTFGSAAAAANLLGLDTQKSAHALGIAAAQAAGLKSMFGTMTKPLHAGKAAMNGLMAAQMAARGFTGNTSGIECEQGFASTQVPEFVPTSVPIDTRNGFAVETNLFKYHAACYLTHSSIEAIRRIRDQHGVGLDDMQSMTLRVAKGHQAVCDIREPQSGLQLKFAIRHLTCMVLDGLDSAALEVYSDINASNPRYVSARQRVEVSFEEQEIVRAAAVQIITTDGQTHEQAFNVAIPASDPSDQWQRLVSKANAIAVPVIGSQRCDAMIACVEHLDTADNLNELMDVIK